MILKQIYKDYLPVNIYISRNTKFFARVEWFFYKKFKRARTIPCGRTKKEKFLSCCQPIDEEHCYQSVDGTKAYCKCCNSIRIYASRPFDLNDPFEF